MSLKLADDRMCYVCGKDNKLGLRLDFEHPETGVLKSSVVFRKEHQGYLDIVHGGMISMVLDEMIVNLAWIEGLPAVTGELTVRLKKPAKIGRKIALEGRIDAENRRGRVLYGTAQAVDAATGELLATAKATCIRAGEKVEDLKKGR